MNLSLWGKVTVLIASVEIQTFKQNLEFFLTKKKLYATSIFLCEMDSFPTLKDTNDEIGGDNNVVLKILLIKICQYYKDLYNSMNQFFSNDQCIMLQNHTWVKESIQSERPMDFDVP